MSETNKKNWGYKFGLAVLGFLLSSTLFFVIFVPPPWRLSHDNYHPILWGFLVAGWVPWLLMGIAGAIIGSVIGARLDDKVELGKGYRILFILLGVGSAVYQCSVLQF